MKIIKASILIVIMGLFSLPIFSQYRYLQINLEITRPIKNLHVRFSVYQDTTTYRLTIKHNPVFLYDIPDTWGKREFDTIIEISQKEFNTIAAMSAKLSSVQISNGAYKYKQKATLDEIKVNLQLDVISNRFSYEITNPRIEIQERNLEQFLLICDSIIRLADKNPEDYY